MITMTADQLDDDSGVATPDGARPAFLASVRHGRYPVVPDALAVAIAALEGADDLEREVLSAPPEGLGPFCQRVADDVLAGRGYPQDFAAAAFDAQQSADRVNAQSVAAQAVRQQLQQRFAGVVSVALPDLLDGLRDGLGETLTGLREVVQALGDLDTADPDAVAAASNKQRAALLRFNELRKAYNVVRVGQRAALEASGITPPGVTRWSYGHGWPQVFASGVHEFSNVRKNGPGAVRPAERFRGLARRGDVWLPSVEELSDAWDLLHPAPTRTAVPVPAHSTFPGSAA